LLLNLLENVLDFYLDVHVYSLLLIDISLPDLHRQPFLGINFFICDLLGISLVDALEVIDDF